MQRHRSFHIGPQLGKVFLSFSLVFTDMFFTATHMSCLDMGVCVFLMDECVYVATASSKQLVIHFPSEGVKKELRKIKEKTLSLFVEIEKNTSQCPFSKLKSLPLVS